MVEPINADDNGLELGGYELEDGYRCLVKCEKATLEAEQKLGAGYRSPCLDGWIKYLGDKFDDSVCLHQIHVSSILHVLIAARRRNWLMRQEIENLKEQLNNARLQHDS